MVGIQPCQVAGVLLEENPEVKSQIKYPLEVTGTRQMDEEARDKQESRDVVELALAAQQLAEERLHEVSGRLINAQEEERRRIARELHDDLNQRLALLSISLEQLGQSLPTSPSEFRKRTQEIQTHAHELSADIQRLSYQLHPSKLDTLGLVAAVNGLCKDLTQHQVLKVEFTQRESLGTVPDDVALCLFRVVQEALRNVAKHSGAQSAKVELIGDAQALHLRISDAGSGFDPDVDKGRNGLGLVSMQERVRLVDGVFTIESSIGRGTQINVQVPRSAMGLRHGPKKPNATMVPAGTHLKAEITSKPPEME